MRTKRWMALLLAATLLVQAAPAFAAEGKDEKDAEIAVCEKDGWDGDSYYKDGKAVKGLQTIKGEKYFFDSKAKLVKSKRVCKVGKDFYAMDKAGVAAKWTKVEKKAASRLYALNKKKAISDKNAAKVLKKAFLWSAKLKYKDNTKKGLSDKKALKYYGEYGFDKKMGDCGTQAATFVYMAKVLGYKGKLIQGTVPTAVNANGKPSQFRTHAWAELKMGKKAYVFDANFNNSSDAKALRKKNKYVGFQFRYGDKNTYRYYTKKHKQIKKTSVK